MIARDELHTILDAIPEARLAAAREALAALADPVLVALLNAPTDDEPLEEEEREALVEMHADRARGDLVPLEDLLAKEEAERR
jgi:hypothetical protein